MIGHSAANGVPVFTIGLGDNISTNVLQAIANQTGGVYYEAPTSSDLQTIYQAISDVLRNQYIVTFTPDASDSDIHTVHMIVTDGVLAGSDTLDFLPCHTCVSDFNTDADVDGQDLMSFISSYSEMRNEADLDANSQINKVDISIFGSEFGKLDCR